MLFAGLAAFALWPTHQTEPVSVTPTPTAKLNSGHEIPLLGLGTSGTSGQQCTDAIVSAVAMGYRVSASTASLKSGHHLSKGQ